MDYFAVIGIMLGGGVLLYTMWWGVGIGPFLNPVAAIVVIGGCIASMIVQYSLSEVMSSLKIVRDTFFHKKLTPVARIETLVEYAALTQREGVLALKKEMGISADSFLRKALRLVLDGVEVAVLREVLETELFSLKDAYKRASAMCAAAGHYALSFGMAGTLIGLITMFKMLNDPEKIGLGMSLALVATLYGVVLAHLFFIPMAEKLKMRTSQELLLKEITIEGIIAVRSGDNSRVVLEKLKKFLSPQS
jgi:chemotaxis protein MotA